MAQNPTSNGQEMFDDMSNDLASTEKSQAHRTTPSRFAGPSSGSKIILGVGILLVIILVVLFFRGSNSASKEDLNALKTRLDQMEKRLASLPAPVPSKSGVRPSSQKAFPSKGAVRYHEVSPGETLYRIANRYHMSVDELCRLNHLKPNQAITPGQKLAVTPNRP